jgi:hypothetical protein
VTGSASKKPKAAPRAAGRREWSKRTERLSLRHLPSHVQVATAAYRALGDIALKWQLADEIAETRGPELTLAYRNVVAVAPGFKSRETKTGRRLDKTPCVIFVVRNKWKPGGARAADPQHLPRCLLAYATVNGERVLCAVPTDVQPETWFHGARAMGPAAVRVDDPDWPALGTLTCAVELNAGGAKQKLLMSARHVFNPRPVLERNPRPGLKFGQIDPATQNALPPVVARSTNRGGILRDDDDEPSFDVQLADNVDWTTARRLLDHLRLSPSEPYVASPARLAELGASSTFAILVAPNHPAHPGVSRVSAQFKTLTLAHAIPYSVRKGDTPVDDEFIHFRRLIQLEILGAAKVVKGDSGSPVAVRQDDGTWTLAGLFIGGGNGLAYAIPAWQLFDADFYKNLPAGATLRPVNA